MNTYTNIYVEAFFRDCLFLPTIKNEISRKFLDGVRCITIIKNSGMELNGINFKIGK